MKGIKVACDYDMWLPVPKDWPWENYRNVDAWAKRVGDAFADAYGWDKAAKKWCVEAVRALSQGTDEEEWRHVYIDPQAQWMYGVSVFWHDALEDMSLDDLAATHDQSVIRPVQRTLVTTEHLGEGVRTLRYVDAGAPGHEVVGILQFGFRADGVDLMVLASSHDLVLHEELMPAVDEFVKTISVVDG